MDIIEARLNRYGGYDCGPDDGITIPAGPPSFPCVRLAERANRNAVGRSQILALAAAAIVGIALGTSDFGRDSSLHATGSAGVNVAPPVDSQSPAMASSAGPSRVKSVPISSTIGKSRPAHPMQKHHRL